MPYVLPPLENRLEALKDALSWAADNTVMFWAHQSGQRMREANRVWGELAVRRIEVLGVPEKRYTMIGDGTGDFPYSEQIVTQNVLHFDLKIQSRNQEHNQTGWFAASRIPIRIYASRVRDMWFRDNDLAIVNLGDVLDVPEGLFHDGRVEDVATMELSFATSLTEEDTSTVVSYIETVEVTSNFKKASDTSLDASLQMNEEVIP